MSARPKVVYFLHQDDCGDHLQGRITRFPTLEQSGEAVTVDWLAGCDEKVIAIDRGWLRSTMCYVDKTAFEADAAYIAKGGRLPMGWCEGDSVKMLPGVVSLLGKRDRVGKVAFGGCVANVALKDGKSIDLCEWELMLIKRGKVGSRP
jgi:hypothetical protein